MIDTKEMTELIDLFINEYGLFYKFKEFVEERGYTLSDFGIEDE